MTRRKRAQLHIDLKWFAEKVRRTVKQISWLQLQLQAGDYSGLEYLEERNSLLICSDEEKVIYEYSLENGLVGSWMFDIEQIEGIAVKEDTLFIVSDAEEQLYIYKLEE